MSTLDFMPDTFDFQPEDIYAPITDGLNAPQKEAVLTTEGPLLILAGAGSGKTRVLTRRIAYLLATRKARRNQIMAVTFTNKAAKEMSERVAALCGNGRFPDVGTFHSVCARWLRRDGQSVGLGSTFAIYATAEQLVVMKEAIRELGLDEKMYTPRGLLSLVSSWKNKMISFDEARRSVQGTDERWRLESCELYQKKLGQNQAVDFDDILSKTVELLRTNKEVRERYQERLRYILIDEYQDVNPVQYELLRLLAEPQRNLCTVGDDDQSIYAFRGADVSILHRFEKDFPEATVIKLEQNYRSTKAILDASNAVVANNVGRKKKELWTDRSGGSKLTYYLAGDGRDEARYIAREIKASGKTLGQFAILYRTNAQSRLLEEAMMVAALPYKVVGGLRFYERKEIKDLLGYLSVLQNPSDSIALRRILNVPARGVGATTMEKLMAASVEKGQPLLQVLTDLTDLGIAGKARHAIENFSKWMTDLAGRIDSPLEGGEGGGLISKMSVPDIIEEILASSGYRKWLEEDSKIEAQARLENIDELINVTAEFHRNSEDKTLVAFLSEVSLLSDQDTYSEDQETVTLMTLHAAKGLEFPVVFLAGLEERTFPHSRSLENPAEMEEERRLCYVGMTRAMEKLYLTGASSRELHGLTDRRVPSRFLKEIPVALLDSMKVDFDAQQEAPAFGSGRMRMVLQSNPRPVRVEPPPPTALQAGQRVRHKIFGVGTVTSFAKGFATVSFDAKGDKTLSAEFLQLEGPVSAGAPAPAPTGGPIQIGDRLEHPRLGYGVVKSRYGSDITAIFGNTSIQMAATEAVRLRKS